MIALDIIYEHHTRSEGFNVRDCETGYLIQLTKKKIFAAMSSPDSLLY